MRTEDIICRLYELDFSAMMGDILPKMERLLEYERMQLPIRPIKDRGGNYLCVCGNSLYVGKKQLCLHYCHNCGRKIEWEK